MNKSILLATLLAAVALTACGKKAEEVPAAAPAAVVAPVVAEAASMAASAVDGMASAATGAMTPLAAMPK
ncbi:hypothetical protein ACVBEH_17415 [Roseateles sp. GG27B]